MKAAPSLIFGWILLVALLTTGCGGDNRTPQERFDAAKAFQAQGEMDAAVEELKGVLQLTPDNAEARFMLGNIYLNTGNVDAAAKELERTYELGFDPELVAIPLLTARFNSREFQSVIDLADELPSLTGDDQVRVLILRGHAKVGLKKLDEADDLYDMAMSLKDDTPEARLGKAEVEVNRGNLVKARDWLGEAINLDGAFGPAWSSLGDIEQFEGNLEAAEIAYSKAIEAEPESVHDLANRALVRISRGDLDAAEKDMKRAVRLNTKARFKQPLAYYAQARVLLERERFERAIAALDKMLEFQPDYLPARYYLAMAHYRLGNIEQADQFITFFRTAAPQYAGAHRLYAAVRFSQGEYDEAAEVLENLLSFLPEDTWSLAMLADIAAAQGDSSQSVEGYRQLVELYPDDEQAHRRLSLGLIQIDPSQARQILSERLEDGGDNRETKTLVLLSYMREGQWDKAVTAAQDLVSEDSANWDAHSLLGGAYVGQGDLRRARASFNRALEIRPGNFNAATNLARLEIQDGNLDAARELYESILENYPDEVAPILYLNALDQQEGKQDKAQERLEQAIEQHPRENALKVAVARLYLAQGSPSRVLAMLQELDGADANTPALLQLAGDARFAMGEYGAAAEDYEKLVRAQPGVATQHFLLGRAYASMGRMDDAQSQLKEALAIDADHYASQILRVHLLRLQGKLPEAQQLLDAMPEDDAGRSEALVEKGWLAMYQANFDEGEKNFAAAFEQTATSDTLVQLGVARWNAGRPESALNGYKAWLRDNPDDPKILVHLGNTYLQLGRDAEALAVFEKLEGMNSGNILVLNNLAWLLRKEDPDRALAYAEKVLRISPEWGPALDTLGSIQLQQGEVELAVRSFQQALKRSPGNPDIRFHLATAYARQGDKTAAVGVLNELLAQEIPGFASRADAEKLLASLK